MDKPIEVDTIFIDKTIKVFYISTGNPVTGLKPEDFVFRVGEEIEPGLYKIL